MTIRVFNSLVLKKVRLNIPRGKLLRIFICGPTVHDDAHLGHARTYIAADVIARYLRYRGYRLLFLMNITDIAEKIDQRAANLGVDPFTLAKRFESRFHEDMKALNVTCIDIYARASDYIPEMIHQISKLMKKGFAYDSETGVYFDIKKFSRYGSLPSDL
jgi:cysteinyl-tRNA synthetase